MTGSLQAIFLCSTPDCSLEEAKLMFVLGNFKSATAVIAWIAIQQANDVAQKAWQIMQESRQNGTRRICCHQS